MKWIKRIAPWIFIGFALIFSASLIFLNTQKDQILGGVLNKVNQYLNVEVAIAAYDLDLFSKFPQVSVKLEDVYCPEIGGKQDSLFFFEEVYFQLDIWDLLQGDYAIRTLSLENGNIEIRHFQNDQWNYVFWKIPNEDTTKSDLLLDFEKIEIHNSQLTFEDQKDPVFLKTKLKSLYLNGVFENEAFYGQTSLDGHLAKLQVAENQIATALPLSGSAAFHFSQDSLIFNNGEGKIKKIAFRFLGKHVGEDLKWRIATEETALPRLMELIPPAYLENTDWFEAKGIAALNIDFEIENGIQRLSADANLKEGSFVLTERDFWLKELSFSAKFEPAQNPKKDYQITLNNTKALTQGGWIEGQFGLIDFSRPTLWAKGKLNTGLYEILQLSSPEGYEAVEGEIKGDFDIRNSYSSFETISKRGLEGGHVSGSIALTNGQFRLAQTNVIFTHINTLLELQNEDILIQKASFGNMDNDFHISGKLNNALSQTKGKPKLDIELTSKKVNLDHFFAWEFAQGNSASQSNEFPINFRVKTRIDAFSLNEWEGKHFEGVIFNDGMTLKGRKIQFNTLSGMVAGDFSFGEEDELYRLIISGNLVKLNMTQLFKSFQNFGQDVLTNDHIEGSLTADLDLSIYCDKNYNFNPASLDLFTNATLEDGRLHNYKPLESLSDFVEAEELKDVRFSTLSNKISIHDEVINIPQMTIKNNALNLDLVGTHSFNNEIDYSVKLKMSDALGRSKKPKNIEPGIIEVDRDGESHLWVRISGTVDYPKIGIDRKKTLKSVGSTFTDEGKEIKELIKGGEPKKKKEEPEFIFEWSEEEPDTTENPW